MAYRRNTTSCRVLGIVFLLAASSVFDNSHAFSVTAPSRKSTTPPTPLPQESSVESPQTPQQPASAAIILNTNARSVSDDLIPVAQSLFGESNVYVTSTQEQAKQAALDIYQKNYSLVVPVGGDGTLSGMVNLLCDQVMANTIQDTTNSSSSSSPCIEDAIGKLPIMGYIPLGTGNGVGNVVGCHVGDLGKKQPKPEKKSRLRRFFTSRKQKRLDKFESILEQMQHVLTQIDKNQQDEMNVIEMPMMQVTIDVDDHENTGDLCFFAGIGFDSLMLNDFKEIKAWAIRKNILKAQLGSVAGYCVALVTKTLPKCIAENAHVLNVTVTTRDPENTMWIDHRRGDFCQVASDDKLLFQGTTGIVAAGTCPFYGGGLRLFPFARMTTDQMHLRLGRIHPLRGFFNIPQIFKGSYREQSVSKFGCIDFIGSDFDISVDQEEFPFQHSGESIGLVNKFRLKVANNKVKFVSFLPKRIVVEE